MAIDLNGNEFYHYDQLREESLIPSAGEVALADFELSQEFPSINWAIEEYYSILERDAVAQNRVAASHLRAIVVATGATAFGGVLIPVGAGLALATLVWHCRKK